MKTAIDFIANGSPWAITDSMMDTIMAIAERNTDPQAIAAQLGRPLNNTRMATERDGVAIIPMDGPVFPKANLFTDISGAHSVSQVALDFNAAQKNPAIHSILMHFETAPGGNAVGIHEFGEMMRKSEKPVIAYVGGMAASAHYWWASAADEVVIDATAQVGNIGVVTGRRLSPDSGNIEIVSSRAPDKRPNAATPEGLAVIQAQVDALEDVFLSSVARNRGMAVEEVAAHRGRILIGEQAVKAGFADRLGSLESVIAGLTGNSNTNGGRMTTSTSTSPADKPELTVAVLKAEHPDIYQSIHDEGFNAAKEGFTSGTIEGFDMEAIKADARAEGANAERERIQSVEAQSISGHEALISTLKFDGETTGEQAAVKVLQAERTSRQSAYNTVVTSRPEAAPAVAEEQQSSADTGDIEADCKAKWDSNADLRKEFSSLDAFVAFSRAKSNGKVRVLGSKE